MSRNGSGTYIPPVNSWSPAVNGNSATANDFNALLADIASAISQSVASDGQTPVTANLAMGNNKITGLAQGTGSGDAVAWEQLFSLGAEVDVASAATTDIGVVNSTLIRITGTITITSFGTTYRGPRLVRFGGALQLTHNDTTLILPGAANITTAAGDCAIVRPVGSPGAGWVVMHYQRAASLINGAASLGANTFTGAQTLPGNAVNALHAVPKQQLDSALANRYLPGERVELYRPTIPAGVNLLKADGTAVSVSTYANLAAAIYCGDANNATASWGYRCTDSANPSTTRSTTGGFIVLPDPRGRFGRALSDGSALDAGRSLWSYQAPFAGSFTWRIESDDGDAQTGSLRSVIGFGINGDERYASNYGPGGYSDTVTTFVSPGDTRGANDAFLVCIGY
jgi:hypothetical protein